MTTGIIVFDHGSRIESANQAVRSVSAELERDLPALIDRISNKHKDIQILSTASLDGHPGLVRILTDRARTALG